MMEIKVVKTARGLPYVIDADGNHLSEVTLKEVNVYPDDQTIELSYMTEDMMEIDVSLHRVAFELTVHVPDMIYASMTGQDFEEEEELDL